MVLTPDNKKEYFFNHKYDQSFLALVFLFYFILFIFFLIFSFVLSSERPSQTQRKTKWSNKIWICTKWGLHPWSSFLCHALFPAAKRSSEKLPYAKRDFLKIHNITKSIFFLCNVDNFAYIILIKKEKIVFHQLLLPEAVVHSWFSKNHKYLSSLWLIC